MAVCKTAGPEVSVSKSEQASVVEFVREVWYERAMFGNASGSA